MPNRLADSVSLYLRQHADNPVDWYEWSDEALQRAVAEDKPIFVSIGYSSCHWCHVMAHESFEDSEVARALNQDFISIKVDREERPDLDEVFITAVQLATGHAGWPLTIFLTPDRLPFFAGTYFPRQGRDQVPGFLTLVGNIASAWRESREEIIKSAEEFASGLNSVLARPMEASLTDVSLVDRALDAMHSSFDYENGGYGTKPKFPPFTNLQFLLEYLETRPTLPGHPDDIRRYCEEAEHIIRLTLSKMLAGSIYDWVGGGIHRYSTDERWHLPHFEKALTDQAQLVRVIAKAGKLGITGFSEQAAQTIYWVENMGGTQNSLWNEDGTIGSAQDADSEGEEGAFSVWTLDEVTKLIGAEAASALGVVAEGNFYEEATGRLTGTNVIVPPPAGFEEERKLLRAAQLTREMPSVDTKAVAAANGMWLQALVEAGELPKASRLASVWLEYCKGEMPHMVQDGQPVGRAFLDDLAHLVDGWLDLAEATDDAELRTVATEIWDREIVRFADSSGRGFFYSAYDPMFPFNRTKPILDSATSGANAVVLRVLRKLGRDEEVAAHLATFLGWAERVPTATETLLTEVLKWLERTPTPLIEKKRDEIAAALHPPVGIVDEDGWTYFEVVAEVPAGMKIPSNSPAADWLSPTRLEVDGAYAEMAYPEGEEDHYTGEVRFPLRVKPLTDARRSFEVKIHYQLCNDSTCFAPTTVSVSGQILMPSSEGNVN